VRKHSKSCVILCGYQDYYGKTLNPNHLTQIQLYALFFYVGENVFFYVFSVFILSHDFRSYYTKALYPVICKILTNVTVFNNTVLYAALSSYPQFIANNKNVCPIFSLHPIERAPIYFLERLLILLKGQCHEIFCFWFF
jgi:hypothetical protein